MKSVVKAEGRESVWRLSACLPTQQFAVVLPGAPRIVLDISRMQMALQQVKYPCKACLCQHGVDSRGNADKFMM